MKTKRILSGFLIINMILFICDGRAGLKVFDATDPLNLELKSHVGGIETYDVILMDDLAIVTGTDGIYQYDYQDLENIKQLSIIR